MKLEKKHKIAIVAVSGVAVIGLAYWLLVARPKKKAKKSILAVNTDTKTETNNSVNWGNDSFPLKKYSKGENVRLLQQKLGVEDDGLFGSKTETALELALGVNTIDKALFDDFNQAKVKFAIVKSNKTIMEGK